MFVLSMFFLGLHYFDLFLFRTGPYISVRLITIFFHLPKSLKPWEFICLVASEILVETLIYFSIIQIFLEWYPKFRWWRQSNRIMHSLSYACLYLNSVATWQFCCNGSQTWLFISSKPLGTVVMGRGPEGGMTPTFSILV